jgi:tetratricopeptide (TPR) repeat protein
MNRFIGLTLAFFLLLSSVNTSLSTEDNSVEDLFFTANRSYKEGRFQEAADGYLRLLGSGLKNGHVYYNLGNAYLRLNELGRAILYYERARLLIPRDADLNFNLRYAHDQTLDAIPVSQSVISQSFFWLNNLTFLELFGAFVILNFAFFLILFTRLFYRAEWTYYVFLVLLIFTIISAISVSLKWYQLRTDDRAIVLKKEVDVLSGPDPQDTVLFKLHEGAIVNNERSEDGWVLVHLSEEKRGWVQSKDLERIIPQKM